MNTRIQCLFLLLISTVQSKTTFDNSERIKPRNMNPYRYEHYSFHKKTKVRRLNETGPVIPNQCGSLGTNEPLQARDCQVFTLSKGYCCYLTITKMEGEEQVERSACIISPNNNPKKKAELINSYSYLEGDVLIECSGRTIGRVLYNYYWLIWIGMIIFY